MITVYGRPDCPYCDKAIELLEETGLDYTYIDIKEHLSALELMRTRGHASVPQVYNEDIHIGGYTDMEAWISRIYPQKVTVMGDVQL